MRPSLSRWSIHRSPMTAGGWDSSATHLSRKIGEESKTSWVTSSLSVSSRIRARMSWTLAQSFWYSSKQASLRLASEGPVGPLVLPSSASGSFRTLEGMASLLEPLPEVLWLRFRSPRGILTLRLREDGASSEMISLISPESMSEALLPGSGACGEGCEVLGVCSFGFEASGPVLPPFGPVGAGTATRALANGGASGTTGGLTTLNTALATLGMKSGSARGGGSRSCHLSRRSSWETGPRPRGSLAVSSTFTSFCSIQEMAAPTAVDQARLVPSRDDEGELLSPVAAILRLPSRPSKSPGKKSLLIGFSDAKPTRTSGATSGCLRGSLRNSWRTLPQ